MKEHQKLKDKEENKKIYNIFKQKSYINYILIFIAASIICIPLIFKTLSIYIDDGVQHISRLIGSFQSLQDNQVLPLIMSNFCNDFGYSWNIFYSPLTAYSPLILKIFNIGYTDILKIFIYAITLLSGVTMYKCTNKIVKNNKIATLAAIFYILSPYRITDMYIRVAIAELASFIFIPIIFNGLYTIINEEKKTYLLFWGTMGLILTHTVITLYMAIFCFIYCIVFIKKLKNKQILKNLLINLFLAVIATSFYWVGLLQHYLATDYEVFIPGRMQRIEILEYFKVEFHQLFITSEEQRLIYSIGMVIIIGLILTPIAWKNIKDEHKKTYKYCLFLGIFLIFTTLTIFPFEKLPSILTMIQFTFRIFQFTSFLFAFVAAINYATLIKDFKYKDVVILMTISILLLLPYKTKLNFNKSYDEQVLVDGVKLTTQTGRVHAGMASMEYLPSKAFNNLDYIAIRENEPIVLEGDNECIVNYNKNGSNMNLILKTSLINIQDYNNTIIELPYIYYLGYNITLNDKNIDYTESNKGFIQINIENNNYNKEELYLKVSYTGTKEMIISYIVSGIIIVIVLIFEIKKIKIAKTRTNY